MGLLAYLTHKGCWTNTSKACKSRAAAVEAFLINQNARSISVFFLILNIAIYFNTELKVSDRSRNRLSWLCATYC